MIVWLWKRGLCWDREEAGLVGLRLEVIASGGRSPSNLPLQSLSLCQTLDKGRPLPSLVLSPPSSSTPPLAQLRCTSLQVQDRFQEGSGLSVCIDEVLGSMLSFFSGDERKVRGDGDLLEALCEDLFLISSTTHSFSFHFLCTTTPWPERVIKPLIMQPLITCLSLPWRIHGTGLSSKYP